MFKVNVILSLVIFNSLLTIKALSQGKITSIFSILKNPIDGKEVILRGRIIDQQEGEQDYIFTDGKDKIVIEMKENDFPYDPNKNIEISGIVNLESKHSQELEHDLTPEDIEIRVDNFRVIDIN
ncbi:MAG: NirD/YgiW/YdeI family stress tolerance protein [Prochloraceae cyanobacterium]|nr:NirD/YgiW/YdeI family stress tolerance protein [Prochloraceae cyanobacterium]